MILKGSTVHSVHHAKKFGVHLFKEENEVIRVRESLLGFSDQKSIENDLRNMQILTDLTKGKTGIFQVSIAPRKGEVMSEQKWDRAVDMIQQEFKLENQFRIQVYHEKEGRPHLHVFYSLVDAERKRLIQVPYYKRRLQRLGVEMEREFGHEKTNRTPGERTVEVSNADRMKYGGKQAYHRKLFITDMWNRSETPERFVTGLNTYGYDVAHGERARFLLIDKEGQVENLVRQLPKTVKTKQVREFFEGYELLTLDQVKEKRERDVELTRHQEEKLRKQKRRVERRGRGEK